MQMMLSMNWMAKNFAVRGDVSYFTAEKLGDLQSMSILISIVLSVLVKLFCIWFLFLSW